MKCPYCEKEMEKGIIQTSGNNLFWDQKTRGPLLFLPSKQGFNLDYQPFGGASLDMYCCKDCKLLLSQYEKM